MFSDKNPQLALLGFLTTRRGKGTHISISTRLFYAKLRSWHLYYIEEDYSVRELEREERKDYNTANVKRCWCHVGSRRWLGTKITKQDQSWKTGTDKTIASHLSTQSPLQISWICAFTRHHSFSQAFSRHTGDNFMNPFKCCILLVSSTSCPRLLSFFTLEWAWEKSLISTF